MFIEYPKIFHLGREETEGILNGHVFLQEKIDGANTSVWMEEGEIHVGQSSREITDNEHNAYWDVEEFKNYILGHEGIVSLLKAHPDWRLFGEWLKPHSLQYFDKSYNHWYLFDILTPEGKMLWPDIVEGYSRTFGIKHPHTFGSYKNPAISDIDRHLGKGLLGKWGEGVVIKNPNFINKFGNCVYAKVVTQKFMEANAAVFGGNNKHSDTYTETYISNKYMTASRVQKIMFKMLAKKGSELDKSDTPKVAMACYYDMITECIWDIQDRVEGVNLKTLRMKCCKKAVVLFHQLLEGFVSVNHKTA